MNQFYYADSSALVKRHITEIGSQWIEQEFEAANGNKVFSTKLSVIEVLSALNRRQREASISATDYLKFSNDFLHFARTEYELADLTDAVLVEAQRLLETHLLRTGDAVQLASAILTNARFQSAGLSSLIFLASDARLLNAANSEGLQTDNPQNHP